MRFPAKNIGITGDFSLDLYSLVGGLEHEFDFSIQLEISSSQLMNSYFSEGLKPPTRSGT